MPMMLMAEMTAIEKAASPQEVLPVADSLTGQKPLPLPTNSPSGFRCRALC